MATASRNPAPATKKTAKKTPVLPRIHKDMSVAEITALLPEAGPLLSEYGLHCFNCAANMSETLEEGYMSHGFQENELDDLVNDLHTMLRERPDRPLMLTVTKPAAEALLGIGAAEGKAGHGLQVGTDETGGFCMEFSATAEEDSLVFFHREVPDMKLFATPLTLSRIGGSTIDFRDGRFKLDLPEDAQKKACACGGKGDCKCGGNCGCKA